MSGLFLFCASCVVSPIPNTFHRHLLLHLISSSVRVPETGDSCGEASCSLAMRLAFRVGGVLVY
jgi:hypothetical protein